MIPRDSASEQDYEITPIPALSAQALYATVPRRDFNVKIQV